MNIFQTNEGMYMKNDNEKDVIFIPEIDKDYGDFKFYENPEEKQTYLKVKDKEPIKIKTFSPFNNGISKIQLENSKSVLLNLDGKMSNEFDYVGNFFNGHAIAINDQVVKFINYDFTLNKNEYSLNDLNFQNGFILVSQLNDSFYLDKYLNFYTKKSVVEKALKKNPYNYEYIPTGYFENKTVILEFLEIAKESFKKQNEKVSQADLDINLTEFKDIVKQKNLEEKENIKERRKYDAKYQKYLQNTIKKIYKFKELTQNNFAEEIDDAFKTMKF